MDHFICSGCGATSPKEVICFNTKCPNAKKLYKKCKCTDGHHFGDFDKLAPKKKAPPANPLDQFTKDLFPQ